MVLAVKSTLGLLLLSCAACVGAAHPVLRTGPPGLPNTPSVTPAYPAGLIRCLDSVVQVTARTRENIGISRGSGVVVSPKVVVTARHMVEPDVDHLLVSQGDVHSEAYCIRRGMGPLDDWAVLVLQSPVGRVAPLVPPGGDAPPALSQAVAIGYALGLPVPTVTYGHVQPGSSGLIRMSAPIIFGNSGGGLFAEVGGELRLVGVTVAVYTSGSAPITHMGISVSIETIVEQGGLKR